MAKRRELKDLHETSVLSSFEHFIIKNGKTYNLISQPDPPDAIVTINGELTWIEITDAFYSQDVAISITSYAADDVPHQPSKGGFTSDPNSIVAGNIISAIRAKLNKNTMKGQAMSSGPGNLLVGVYGPFVDVNEMADNLSDELADEVASQTIFSSIYIYETDGVEGHIFRNIM